jgi:hypothetical protein
MKAAGHRACAGTSAVTLLAILAFCVITLGSAGHATPHDTDAAAIASATSPRAALQCTNGSSGAA